MNVYFRDLEFMVSVVVLVCRFCFCWRCCGFVFGVKFGFEVVWGVGVSCGGFCVGCRGGW